VANWLRNRTRIEETLRNAELLDRRIIEWIGSRRQADKLHQYRSQLDALDHALSGSLAALRNALDQVDPAAPSSDVYTLCRNNDKRLCVIGRAWDFFRVRFDQREDPSLGPTVAVADEVVWSCYAEAVRAAMRLPPGSPLPVSSPLPYIEHEYAARALPRDEPPHDVHADGTDTILADYLDVLPVPVIGLPDSCVTAPWWLSAIGHEVGHQLQPDLAAEWAVTADFGQLMRRTATADPLTGDAAGGRWHGWQSEVFADACWAHSMGTAALIALVELELGNAASMHDARRVGYPAAVVRLALFAEVLRQLGQDPGTALQGVELDVHADSEPKELREDLELVPTLATAVVAHDNAGVGTLKELFDWQPDDHGPDGSVARWARDFETPDMLFPEKSLRAPRQLVAGAVLAWVRIAAIDDKGYRAEARERLRESLLSTTALSHEEFTRASAPPPAADPAKVAERAAGLLLADTWLADSS
jgi:hypothetical protein